jgi:hypothetical protein
MSGANLFSFLSSPHLTSPSDILNYSYFDKRNIYLGFLSCFLSEQSDLVQELSIAYLKNDNRKPILVIRPNIRTSYTVRLFISVCLPPHPLSKSSQASDQSFKLTQLRPSKNNVRPSWWIDTLAKIRNDPQRSAIELDSKSLAPTPHYNMAILEDVILLGAHDYLAKCCDKVPHLRDIMIVTKVVCSALLHSDNLCSDMAHSTRIKMGHR